MNSQANGFGWLFGPDMDVIALLELTKDIAESKVLTFCVQIHIKKAYEHYWETNEQRVVALHAVDKRELSKMKNKLKINGVIFSMDGQFNYKVSDHVSTLKDKASNLIRSNVSTMGRIA